MHAIYILKLPPVQQFIPIFPSDLLWYNSFHILKNVGAVTGLLPWQEFPSGVLISNLVVVVLSIYNVCLKKRAERDFQIRKKVVLKKGAIDRKRSSNVVTVYNGLKRTNMTIVDVWTGWNRCDLIGMEENGHRFSESQWSRPPVEWGTRRIMIKSSWSGMPGAANLRIIRGL